MDPIKLIIADDHPVYLDGLKQLLLVDPQFEILHEAHNGREALEQARALKPDLLLLDLDMPGMSGIEVSEACKQNGDAFAIILLTMHNEEDIFNEAMNLGVRGYVLKDTVAAEIRNAVHTVAGGKPYVSPALTEYLLNRNQQTEQLRKEKSGLDSLTASERRILKMIATDRTSKEIAADLGLSPRTVENHRTNACAKLGLHGSHALLKFAFENKGKL